MRLGRMRLVLALVVLAFVLPTAAAPHFYRSANPGACSERDGALTDDGSVAPGDVTVRMLHNTFDPPAVRIAAGDAVTWTWNSLHCHSVSHPSFESGHHWPAQTGPVTGDPRFFHYPLLELSPTLSFTHTFDTPGTYAYSCFHHGVIGMVGVVVVE